MNFLDRIKRVLLKRLIIPLIERHILRFADIVASILAKRQGNPAHDIFYQQGFHLLRKHYYLPLPEEEDVTNGFWEKTSDLIGIDINAPFALNLLKDVFPLYMNEFRSKFPLHATDNPLQFYLINGGYMAIDAHIYYSLIRHYKPRRIIEIGAGNSTLLASAACLQNQEETGRPVNLTAIDPFPYDLYASGKVTGLSYMIKSKVQHVNMELFTSLEDGDILFIDSSHVLKSGGDVQTEYLEILPRLAQGVLVHIHDISLPRAYPSVYYENQLYWNEQYLLQAFLAFNSRFEVVWPGNYMMLNYPDKVCAVFPEFNVMRQQYPQSEPTAFWIRVRT